MFDMGCCGAGEAVNEYIGHVICCLVNDKVAVFALYKVDDEFYGVEVVGVIIECVGGGQRSIGGVLVEV